MPTDNQPSGVVSSSSSLSAMTHATDYKRKYKTLKKKLKFLVYEQETLREELGKSQRRLIQASRDKNFLLDRLLHYEDVDDSDADSEATVSSDSETEQLKTNSSAAKESAMSSSPAKSFKPVKTASTSEGTKTAKIFRRDAAVNSSVVASRTLSTSSSKTPSEPSSMTLMRDDGLESSLATTSLTSTRTVSSLSSIFPIVSTEVTSTSEDRVGQLDAVDASLINDENVISTLAPSPIASIVSSSIVKDDARLKRKRSDGDGRADGRTNNFVGAISGATSSVAQGATAVVIPGESLVGVQVASSSSEVREVTRPGPTSVGLQGEATHGVLTPGMVNLGATPMELQGATSTSGHGGVTTDALGMIITGATTADTRGVDTPGSTSAGVPIPVNCTSAKSGSTLGQMTQGVSSSVGVQGAVTLGVSSANPGTTPVSPLDSISANSVSANFLHNIQLLIQQKTHNMKMLKNRQLLLNQSQSQPLVTQLLKQIQIQQILQQQQSMKSASTSMQSGVSDTSENLSLPQSNASAIGQSSKPTDGNDLNQIGETATSNEKTNTFLQKPSGSAGFTVINQPSHPLVQSTEVKESEEPTKKSNMISNVLGINTRKPRGQKSAKAKKPKVEGHETISEILAGKQKFPKRPQQKISAMVKSTGTVPNVSNVTALEQGTLNIPPTLPTTIVTTAAVQWSKVDSVSPQKNSDLKWKEPISQSKVKESLIQQLRNLKDRQHLQQFLHQIPNAQLLSQQLQTSCQPQTSLSQVMTSAQAQSLISQQTSTSLSHSSAPLPQTSAPIPQKSVPLLQPSTSLGNIAQSQSKTLFSPSQLVLSQPQITLLPAKTTFRQSQSTQLQSQTTLSQPLTTILQSQPSSSQQQTTLSQTQSRSAISHGVNIAKTSLSVSGPTQQTFSQSPKFQSTLATTQIQQPLLLHQAAFPQPHTSIPHPHISAVQPQTSALQPQTADPQPQICISEPLPSSSQSQISGLSLQPYSNTLKSQMDTTAQSRPELQQTMTQQTTESSFNNALVRQPLWIQNSQNTPFSQSNQLSPKGQSQILLEPNISQVQLASEYNLLQQQQQQKQQQVQKPSQSALSDSALSDSAQDLDPNSQQQRFVSEQLEMLQESLQQHVPLQNDFPPKNQIPQFDATNENQHVQSIPIQNILQQTISEPIQQSELPSLQQGLLYQDSLQNKTSQQELPQQSLISQTSPQPQNHFYFQSGQNHSNQSSKKPSLSEAPTLQQSPQQTQLQHTHHSQQQEQPHPTQHQLVQQLQQPQHQPHQQQPILQQQQLPLSLQQQPQLLQQQQSQVLHQLQPQLLHQQPQLLQQQQQQLVHQQQPQLLHQQQPQLLHQQQPHLLHQQQTQLLHSQPPQVLHQQQPQLSHQQQPQLSQQQQQPSIIQQQQQPPIQQQQQQPPIQQQQPQLPPIQQQQQQLPPIQQQQLLQRQQQPHLLQQQSSQLQQHQQSPQPVQQPAPLLQQQQLQTQQLQHPQVSQQQQYSQQQQHQQLELQDMQQDTQQHIPQNHMQHAPLQTQVSLVLPSQASTSGSCSSPSSSTSWDVSRHLSQRDRNHGLLGDRVPDRMPNIFNGDDSDVSDDDGDSYN